MGEKEDVIKASKKEKNRPCSIRRNEKKGDDNPKLAFRTKEAEDIERKKREVSLKIVNVPMVLKRGLSSGQRRFIMGERRGRKKVSILTVP